MKFLRKLLVLTSVFALLGVASVQGSAAAQIGYSPDEPVILRVGSGKADFDGKFAINYTAAPEVNDPHLIYVIGTDKDGEDFEWLALQITPEQAGEGVTIEGSDLQPGSNFGLEARYDGQTLEDVDLEEAETLVSNSTAATINVGPIGTATEAGDTEASAAADDDATESSDGDDGDDADDGEEAAAPSTSDSGGSSTIALLVGFAIMIAVIIGAIAYGRRLRTRYT